MSLLQKKLFPVIYIPSRTLLRIFATIVFIVLILVPCVIFFDVSVPSELLESSYLRKQRNVEIKTILYWTGMFNSKTFYLGEKDLFKGCKMSACRATHKRNFMEIDKFDALLFHGIETKRSDIPPARSSHQKYVFVDLESPANHALDEAYLPDEFYNWTMTYRRDSTIPRAYGYVIHSPTNQVAYPIWARDDNSSGIDAVLGNYPSEGNDHGRFEGKRITAAWFVSHCRTVGLRERYVNELKKHIDIDIYGDCGPHSCKSGNVKCYKMLEDRYYFYIAFENSLCQDYVTEKLYKVMSYDVVPIVYGAVNYTEFVPPGSYINVADFESPKDLAKRLNYLINNPEEYQKFFYWKKDYFVDLSHHVTLCKICEMLHNEKELAPSSIVDLKKWWSKGKCQDAEKFMEKIIRK